LGVDTIPGDRCLCRFADSAKPTKC
jgi:hypothetical protein